MLVARADVKLSLPQLAHTQEGSDDVHGLGDGHIAVVVIVKLHDLFKCSHWHGVMLGLQAVAMYVQVRMGLRSADCHDLQSWQVPENTYLHVTAGEQVLPVGRALWQVWAQLLVQHGTHVLYCVAC